MADRTTFHVIPDAQSWKVKNEDDATYDALVDNKDRAVELAREYAKQAPLGQVIVHTRDGRIAEEFTYGEDPRGTPG
ncbi:MAG: hypothetical protein QOI20_619 [Acidimicrobiaceae bacterium]|jgi:hypothetical protein|nr:hypothetical protein [Acidimicrobiaceae bacterium]